MGARFAPSVANPFMACWEAGDVLWERPSELVVYKRYMDDLSIVWKGTDCPLIDSCLI